MKENVRKKYQIEPNMDTIIAVVWWRKTFYILYVFNVLGELGAVIAFN